MSWSTLRRATEEDVQKLQAAAARFAKRHNLTSSDENGEDCVPSAVDIDLMLDERTGLESIYPEDRAYLRKLWRAAVQRALGKGCEGIAYGYVGSHVE